MKKSFPALAIFLLIASFGEVKAQKNTSTYSALEAGIISQFNRIRTDPTAYANWIEANMGSLPYAPKNLSKSTIKEAIRELRNTKPLPLLTVSKGLNQAAMVHVKDQLGQDSFSHTGTDGSGPLERMRRYGTLSRGGYENAIVFNSESAEGMVLGWIIDNFSPERGHRKPILSSDILFTGVACGARPREGRTGNSILCVADFAKNYIDNP